MTVLPDSEDWSPTALLGSESFFSNSYSGFSLESIELVDRVVKLYFHSWLLLVQDSEDESYTILFFS